VGVICLIKKISDTAMKKIMEYSNQIDTLLVLKEQEITERKKAEKALINAHYELEEKVQERTADLSETNLTLEKEIAERKHAESMLEGLVQQKDMFITRLGHDLKTPLTPLTGLIPIIRKQEKDPGNMGLLDACMQNVDRIKYLVIKTIKLARAGSVSENICLEDIPLMLKVNEYIDKIGFMLKENGTVVKNNIRPEITVRANEADLEELFNNLISNAAKYSQDNGEVTVDAEPDDEMIRISVKDTGMGLSNDHIQHVFDEFYKVDESRHELNSSGLGLSICKKIADSHGGRIWAESAGEGHGSTFNFTLKSGGNRS
jgi:signal transduction histidine kinase